MKTISLIFMTLALIFLASLNIFACKCPAQPIEQSFAESSAVFYGRVESVKYNYRNIVAVLKVEKSWKGVDTETVSVSSEASTCGINFQVGEAYYLFVDGGGNGLYQTVACRRHAGEQEDFLKNRPTIPLRQTSPPPVSDLFKSSNLVGMAVLIISVVIGLAVLSILFYLLRAKKE